ncbi:LOW QUALITY PROTEIN: hypothetical protein V2J09_006070 [Rumex salicifolius]
MIAKNNSRLLGVDSANSVEPPPSYSQNLRKSLFRGQSPSHTSSINPIPPVPPSSQLNLTSSGDFPPLPLSTASNLAGTSTPPPPISAQPTPAPLAHPPPQSAEPTPLNPPSPPAPLSPLNPISSAARTAPTALAGNAKPFATVVRERRASSKPIPLHFIKGITNGIIKNSPKLMWRENPLPDNGKENGLFVFDKEEDLASILKRLLDVAKEPSSSGDGILEWNSTSLVSLRFPFESPSQILMSAFGLNIYFHGRNLSCNRANQIDRIPWRGWRNYPARYHLQLAACQMSQMPKRRNGLFVFHFDKEEDLASILERGPWMLGGQRAIILKRWKIGMELDLFCLTEVPIWITLPNLDVRFWSEDMLAKIGSAIGTSVLTDFNSAHQEKLSFARVMVEIPPSTELICSVEFHDEDGEIIQQHIIYNWLPTRCPNCQVFGHYCAA